jgi:hypothetical protein
MPLWDPLQRWKTYSHWIMHVAEFQKYLNDHFHSISKVIGTALESICLLYDTHTQEVFLKSGYQGY